MFVGGYINELFDDGRERDELMSALKRFEHQIEDMRRQAEIISEERDAVEGLYKQVIFS